MNRAGAAADASGQTALDAWTVVAIAVVAYLLSNLVHEGLGHGGACLLAGGQPRVLNAVFFDCNTARMSEAGVRWMAAAGSLANLALAAVAWALLRRGPAMEPRLRYCFWLLLAVNLLQAFGYLLFSGIGGVGDWAAVVEGARPALVFRLLLTVLGGWLYFVFAPRVFMPLLEPFLGESRPARMERARLLTLLPYLAGGLAYVAAGVLNPYGMKLVLLSAAAASFGGTSLLAWYPPLWARLARPAPPGAPLGVARSRGWVIATLALLTFFVGVLGPGIHFGG
jgi:hypothetical protein